MAGLRWENLFISGTQYDKLNTRSPRFNCQMAAERKHSDSGRMGSDREAAFVLCTLSPTGVSGYSDFRSLIQ